MILKVTNGSWCQEFDTSGRCIKQWFEAGDVEWEGEIVYSDAFLDSLYYPFETAPIVEGSNG